MLKCYVAFEIDLRVSIHSFLNIRHFQLNLITDIESDNGLSINIFEGSYKI